MQRMHVVAYSGGRSVLRTTYMYGMALVEWGRGCRIWSVDVRECGRLTLAFLGEGYNQRCSCEQCQ